MLVGHYEMLAMTLNALAVEPDVFGGWRAAPRLAPGTEGRCDRDGALRRTPHEPRGPARACRGVGS